MKRKQGFGHWHAFGAVLAFGAAVCVVGWGRAREATAWEAAAVAEAWVARNGVLAEGVSGRRVLEPVAVCDASGVPLYYKVGFEGGGMVVVSGETRVEPVIAVVPEAEGTELPEGHPLSAWLETDVTGRREVATMDYARAAGPTLRAAGIVEAEARWGELLSDRVGGMSSYGAAVSPAKVYALDRGWLDGTYSHWNQGASNAFVSRGNKYLYNLYTPNHYVAGCGAISMAGVIQFYRIPEGPSATRTCTVSNVSTSLSTKGGTYDWSIMPKWKRGIALTEEQVELMGRVAYDAGVCVGMGYASGGSWSYTHRLAESLRDDYGLHGVRVGCNNTSAVYEVAIYSQTRARQPVLLNIQGNGGHFVLAVGYAEEDSGSPCVRVCMGWGGSSDAWYLLPKIASFNSIPEVVTQLGPMAETMALCGTVTDAAGAPCVLREVWVRDAEGKEVARVRTGAYGQFAVRVRPDTRGYRVGTGEVAQAIAVGAAMASTGYVNGNTYAAAAPKPIALVAKEGTPSGYGDLAQARQAALAEGKALFVLRGAGDDEETLRVMAAIEALGDRFWKRFALTLCDAETGETQWLGDGLRFAAFHAATFAASQGWEQAARLAEATEATPEALAWVVACAEAIEAPDTVAAMTLEGPEAVLEGESAGYAVRFAFKDGWAPEVAFGGTWKVRQGTGQATCTAEGVVTGVRPGQVTLCACFVAAGSERAVERPLAITAIPKGGDLRILGGEEPLDFEETDEARFRCLERQADGSEVEVAPVWTVTASDASLRPQVSPEGVLTYGGDVGYAFDTHTLTLTATYRSRTQTCTITVWGIGRLRVKAWAPNQTQLYPGSVVRVRLSEAVYESRGQTLPVGDLSQVEVRLEASGTVEGSFSERIPIPFDVSAIKKTTLRVSLFARRRGSRHAPWTEAEGGARNIPVTTYLGAVGSDVGNVPLGWLMQFFGGEVAANGHAKAMEDSDGDGLLNWEEYIVGTDPTDASDALRITEISPRPGAIPEISWEPRLEHRVYTLQGKASLADPAWGEPSVGSRFFRIVVDRAK